MKELTVKSAKHITNHRLEVTFSDGARREVDFKPFLQRFRHPDLERYKKVTEFKKYKVIDGNINWHDYNMIFPVEDLYKGEIR